MEDGTRQVLDVYVPGDIIGLRDYGFQRRVSNHLHLSLTQTLLADALGLSVVHVNRTFHELKEEKLVDSPNSDTKLLDIEGLKKVAQFDPSYLEENLDGVLKHIRK